MDFGTAIETQRDALLRHLASLFAVVRFLSVGPFSNRLPRWVRGLIVYLLRPAEDAAECLVGVMADVMRRSGREVSLARSSMSVQPLVGGFGGVDSDLSFEDTTCSNVLIARMQALWDKLENLEAHALRALLRPKARPARRNRRAQRTWPLRQSGTSKLNMQFQYSMPIERISAVPP